MVGVDSSEVMIEMAQENFPEQSWIQADMRQMDLGQKFQGILAWDSFFHLTQDDQRAMFSIFEKHAKQICLAMLYIIPVCRKKNIELYWNSMVLKW